jgi:hypothetical protein
VSADVLGLGEDSFEVEGFGDSALGDFLGDDFSVLGDFSDFHLGVFSALLFLEESELFGGDFLGDSLVIDFLAGDLSKIAKACLDLDLTGLSSSLSLTILFFLDLLTLTGDIDSSSFSDLTSDSSFVSTLISFSSFFGDLLGSSSILIFFGACACKVLSSEDRFPGLGAVFLYGTGKSRLVSGRPSAAAAVVPFFLSPSFSPPLKDLFGVTFSLLLVGLTFSSLESTYFGFSAEVVLALFGVKNDLK